MEEEQKPIILFDGFCNLCNGTIDFLLKHDKKKQFSFVPLQSDKGQQHIQKFNIPNDVDSVILIKSNYVYFESEAVVEIAGLLNFPWRSVRFLKYFPKKIRDRFYHWIAKNRYHWFGKRDSCRIQN